MTNPYGVVESFEKALCEYTGAKYAVAVDSCTNALLICMLHEMSMEESLKPRMILPKYTYVSVPMAAKLAGFDVQFSDTSWGGLYRCQPYPIWDSARFLSKGMYREGQFICLSFHWTKTLAIGRGGAILHDSDIADPILRRMRFDGRSEGVAPKDDTFPVLGIHAYMTPAMAAEGLSRLALLPDHNDPLPNSDYPDLSKYEIFK